MKVEGSVGLVGLKNSISGSETLCPQSRVYMDLDSEAGRVIYSTTLTALVAKNTVSIRASDSAPKNFGACQICDIVILSTN